MSSKQSTGATKARPKVFQTIKSLQRRTTPMIAKATFLRETHRLIDKPGAKPEEKLVIQTEAASVLQAATERYIVDLLMFSNCLALYAGRKSLQKKDIQFVREIMDRDEWHLSSIFDEAEAEAEEEAAAHTAKKKSKRN